ncbi:hypothetical protein [Algoriphagus sp. CAU 1675]|uniref:hypothetical protein n=1 Tax=Algoriphagus sp. CAU 1675 TaxID=3032597 RepID=UPI0023DA5C03|nr:hypothetical protein [Algoriphagus sp. CAU 1675]MDF2159280.1 hypothetical protein [Algoriphagus sp. CAU 1675]
MKTRIKIGMICHGIHPESLLEQNQIPADYCFKAGDIGLFEVLEIGKHSMIQTAGRNMTLVKGDLIMGAFGNRYATNQFEGYVPESLQEEYHMLGGGGVIGVVKTMHSKYDEIGPTRLKMIGLYADRDGNISNSINSKKENLIPFSGKGALQTRVILSLGSSMDSGKTTTAAYLIHGLRKKGYKASYIKLTGTAYPKDKNLAYDMGANQSIDFSKYGYPSTFLCSEQEILNLYESLLRDVLVYSPDYVIIEIADGLFQRETKMLLNNQMFTSGIHQLVFSAADSLSAVQGVSTLKKLGIMPSALSGLFTASSLLITEVKEYLLDKENEMFLPIFTLEDLEEGNWPVCTTQTNLLLA